jgi:hypothetical protein
MTAIGIAAGAVLFSGLIYRFYSRSANSALAQVRRTGDVAPLVERLNRLGSAAAVDAYNSAIRRLWDAYERESAARLIRALVEGHSAAPIAQYWLDQIQKVEPEIAESTLGSAFISRYYDPTVASGCGPCGCTL